MDKTEIRKIERLLKIPKGKLTQDFYANHKDNLNRLNKLSPNYGNEIDSRLRWKTLHGVKVLNIIREFIKSKVEEGVKLKNVNISKGIYTRYIDIDFNLCLIEGQCINDYMYSQIPKNAQYKGMNDLSGIPLYYVKFFRCNLKNAQFSYADFVKCKLNFVSAENCVFNKLNIVDSHFFGVDANFSNSKWKRGTISNHKIDESSFGTHSSITKMNLFALLEKAIVDNMKGSYLNSSTEFHACTLIESEQDESFNKLLSEIKWNQNTQVEFGLAFKENSFLIRIFLIFKNILKTLTTRNWSSPNYTILSGFIIIISFAFVYNNNSLCFSGINSFWDSILTSIQIFTTLGILDSKVDCLSNNLVNSIATFEALIGYFWLALILIMMTKKNRW